MSGGGTREKDREWRFPSALTVLAAVTVGVWLAAFPIPPGAYERDADGTFADRLMDLFLSPVNGLYAAPLLALLFALVCVFVGAAAALA